MRRTISLLMVLALAPAVARAERRNPLENQPSIRHKVEMRKMRFEISPQLVVSLNQPFRHFIGGGLVLHFHIADWIGVGAQLAGGGGLDTGLTDRVVTATKNPLPQQPTTQQFLDHISTINFILSLYATLTPFAGKLSLFGALFLRYDLYAMAGLGGINTTNSWTRGKIVNGVNIADPLKCSDSMNPNPNHCDPSNAGFAVAGMFGAGTHLFFNDFIGLQLEVRNYVASGNPGGLDVNQDPQRKVNDDDKTVQNNFMFSLGLTFMLPPKAKVSP